MTNIPPAVIGFAILVLVVAIAITPGLVFRKRK